MAALTAALLTQHNVRRRGWAPVFRHREFYEILTVRTRRGKPARLSLLLLRAQAEFVRYPLQRRVGGEQRGAGTSGHGQVQGIVRKQVMLFRQFDGGVDVVRYRTDGHSVFM